MGSTAAPATWLQTMAELAANYLFIQVSILAFIAPFWWFPRRGQTAVPFSWLGHAHLREFFASTPAHFLVFAWAAAEAVVWFVIPEFLLLLIVFLRAERKIYLLGWDVAGTAAGTVLGLGISVFTHFDVSSVPYVTPNMVSQVEIWYQGLGPFAVFCQPFSGVPYKVFVLGAAVHPMNLWAFLGLAVAVRVGRYAIFYFLFVGLFPVVHRFVSKNYLPVALAGCMLFSVLLLQVTHFYGPAYVADDREVKAILQAMDRFRIGRRDR